MGNKKVGRRRGEKKRWEGEKNVGGVRTEEGESLILPHCEFKAKSSPGKKRGPFSPPPSFASCKRGWIDR